MRARTYRAKTIQKALDQIKNDLGSEAMILSTQQLVGRHAFGLIRRNSWEITAAVNDSGTIEEAKAASLNPLQGVVMPVSQRLQHNDLRFEKLLEEVNGLKRTLQFITRTIPETPQELSGIYGELVTLGFDPQAADALVASAAQINPQASDLREQVRQALAEKFMVEPPLELVGKARTVSVFVGPTGMGKTTAIAKIAGHARARHRKRVTLISTDTFRVGGQDQLAAYGNLMDMPAYSCSDRFALERLIGNLDDDLILIDTPGLSPADDARLAAVRALGTIPNARVHAVISATTPVHEIDRFMSAMALATPVSMLISKTDEAESIGALLIHALQNELPISFATDGPNVPEDLAIPTADDLAYTVLPDDATPSE